MPAWKVVMVGVSFYTKLPCAIKSNEVFGPWGTAWMDTRPPPLWDNFVGKKEKISIQFLCIDFNTFNMFGLELN